MYIICTVHVLLLCIYIYTYVYVYIYDIDKHLHTIIYCHTYTLHQTRHQLFIHFTMRYHGEPKYNLDTLDCVTWDKSLGAVSCDEAFSQESPDAEERR